VSLLRRWLRSTGDSFPATAGRRGAAGNRFRPLQRLWRLRGALPCHGDQHDNEGKTRSTNMNVSGVLVRARPERFPEVISALRDIGGVEIHETREAGGQIVLTVEDGPHWSVEDSLLKVHLVDGISDAALVYQYSDENMGKEMTT
jgi:nitrate reductase NapAB chaperone NapD